MAKLLLIRHGRTALNEEGRFRGRADVPLSAVGRAQAEALAARLAPELLDAVYSSPLLRAVETAQAIAGPRGISIQRSDLLLDISYGDWEGRLEADVEEEQPELLATWRHDPRLVRPPRGESLSQVHLRSAEFLTSLVREHPHGWVAAVSHRVPNKLMLGVALGLGEKAFWRVRQDTACLNIIEAEGRSLSVRLLNDTCHLSAFPPDASDF